MNLLEWAVKQGILKDYAPIATDAGLADLAQHLPKLVADDAPFAHGNVSKLNPSLDKKVADSMESWANLASVFSENYLRSYQLFSKEYFSGENPTAFIDGNWELTNDRNESKATQSYAKIARNILQRNFSNALQDIEAQPHHERNLTKIYRVASDLMNDVTLAFCNHLNQRSDEASERLPKPLPLYPDPNAASEWSNFREDCRIADTTQLTQAARRANTEAAQKKAEAKLAEANKLQQGQENAGR